MAGQKSQGEKNHEAREHVEQDVREPITHRVEVPDLKVHGVTQNPEGLVIVGPFKLKDPLDSLPVQPSDLRIIVDHPVIPVRKLMPQRVNIEESRQQRDR
jgi:hypothetical protein